MSKNTVDVCVHFKSAQDYADMKVDLVEHIFKTSHLGHAIFKCKHCGQIYVYEFYIDPNGDQNFVYSVYVPVENIESAKAMLGLNGDQRIRDKRPAMFSDSGSQPQYMER